jgi:hypothetical protein
MKKEELEHLTSPGAKGGPRKGPWRDVLEEKNVTSCILRGKVKFTPFWLK